MLKIVYSFHFFPLLAGLVYQLVSSIRLTFSILLDEQKLKIVILVIVFPVV